jgi:ABC-type multidrug transport system ATPase subunit
LKFGFDEICCKGDLLIKAGNIDVPDKGVTLLQGPNGAGKTLFAKMLFSKCLDKAVYIDQSSDVIVHELSVVENISFSDDSSVNSQIENFLKEAGLSRLMFLDSKKLSGGEKRVIALLRGLFSDSNILFIDEITNDLSVDAVSFAVSIIEAAKKNKCIFIISHDDRIEKMADRSFAIKNKEIIEIATVRQDRSAYSNTSEVNGSLASIIASRKHSDSDMAKKARLSRVYSNSYVHVVLCALFIAVFFMIFGDIKAVTDMSIPKIKDGQIEIFNPVSTIGQNVIALGAMPTAVMGVIRETNTQNMLQLNDRLKQAVKEAMSSPVTFELDIPYSEEYSLYPLEFYEPELRENIYTYQYYFDRFGISDDGSAQLDTDMYFTDPLKTSGDKDARIYGMDSAIFDSSARAIQAQGKKVFPVFYALVANSGVDEYSIADKPFLKRIQYANYYFRNNDTITVTNELRSMESMMLNAKRCLLIMVVALLASSLYTYLYMNINSRKINIHKNYNCDAALLTKVIGQKINNKHVFLSLAFLLPAAFTLEGALVLGRMPNMGEFSMCAIFILMLVLLRISSGLIIRKRIKSIFRWTYR